MQVNQNICIHFCLKPNSRHDISAKECNVIKWLPANERAEQRRRKRF